MNMSSVLRSLVGRKVAIFSAAGQSGVRDDGIVQNVDETVLVLDKGSEPLVFVIANIRLIKILE